MHCRATPNPTGLQSDRLARLLASLLLVVLLSACVAPGQPTIALGRSGGFAVLAGLGITNSGSTTVAGDIGSYPTPAQTGFGPGADSVTLAPGSTNHSGDAVTQGAKEDLVAAYDAAAEAGPASAVVGDLGGQTLGPGVYADNNSPDSLAITGILTLDGRGAPDSVFIFQSGSTLVTASNSTVVLVGGAQACNVFWQVTSSATLGTGSHFEGTILAQSGITLDTGATVNGRALARDGAVTMHSNTIRKASCVTPPPASGAPTTSVPVFPTTAALVLGGAGALAAASIVVRRRR